MFNDKTDQQLKDITLLLMKKAKLFAQICLIANNLKGCLENISDLRVNYENDWRDFDATVSNLQVWQIGDVVVADLLIELSNIPVSSQLVHHKDLHAQAEHYSLANHFMLSVVRSMQNIMRVSPEHIRKCDENALAKLNLAFTEIQSIYLEFSAI